MIFILSTSKGALRGAAARFEVHGKRVGRALLASLGVEWKGGTLAFGELDHHQLRRLLLVVHNTAGEWAHCERYVDTVRVAASGGTYSTEARPLATRELVEARKEFFEFVRGAVRRRTRPSMVWSE